MQNYRIASNMSHTLFRLVIIDRAIHLYNNDQCLFEVNQHYDMGGLQLFRLHHSIRGGELYIILYEGEFDTR